MIAEIDGC